MARENNFEVTTAPAKTDAPDESMRKINALLASGPGSSSDTAATSDTGTFSLVALFKRFLSKLTALSNATGTAINTSSPDSTVVLTMNLSQTQYSSGDCIGGKLEVPNAVAVANGSSLLHEVTITDALNQKPTGNLVIFNADPTAATLTDNAVMALGADLTKVATIVPVNSADWVTIGTQAVCSIKNIGSKITMMGGDRKAFAALQNVTTTPTFSSASALRITLKFLPVNA